MPRFTKTQQQERTFRAFEEKIDKLKGDLAPYADCVRLDTLDEVKVHFIKRTSDFFREDRKLNIGVIGQVKAGKSSFLNTLLFDGHKVLPSAATPKTATLTKIEYGEQNRLCVEYYTPEEWAVLEHNASVDSMESEFVVAREIMSMVATNGIVPAQYTQRGEEEFRFESANQLMEQLNDYVGENGKYTPLVKNVTIQMDRPELRDISVVDTPGLNDAIASRTDRTRQFVELCDVVFFLSRASQFMDNNDMKLLASQLPQRGVKDLVMICSRFDDGLADIILDAESIEEAIRELERDLTKRAVSVVNGVTQNPELQAILEPCKKPIFVSSLCWNMAQKSPDQYDEQELHALGCINEYDDVDQQVLKAIGNMQQVQERFICVVSEKDQILSEKAGTFLQAGENELKEAVKGLREEAEHTLNILCNSDRTELEEKKKAIATQINGISAQVESVFGELLARLDLNKIETIQQLRTASGECAQLQTHQGTDIHQHSHRVSDFDWRHPIKTFGQSHTEYTYTKSPYSYLDANDALENIRSFAYRASRDIEHSFTTTVDVMDVKRKLLNVIVDGFDTSSELYDPAYFRLVTARTLSSMEFPVMKIDISKEQAAIASGFSGEVRESGEKAKLQQLMFKTMEHMLKYVIAQFETEVANFRQALDTNKSTFLQQLLENIQADYDRIAKEFEDKEQRIKVYQDFLTLLKVVSKKA